MMGEPINSRAKALLKLGLAHWHKGDYEAAARFLNTVINLAAVFCDHQFEALCYNAIAWVETDLGKLEEAIHAYETAASLDPVHFSPWKEIGNLYSQSDKYEEAMAAFKKAIERNPNDSLGWNGLGDVYHKLGRSEDAISAYQLGNVFDRPVRSNEAFTVTHRTSDTEEENPRVFGGDGKH